MICQHGLRTVVRFNEGADIQSVRSNQLRGTQRFLAPSPRPSVDPFPRSFLTEEGVFLLLMRTAVRFNEGADIDKVLGLVFCGLFFKLDW